MAKIKKVLSLTKSVYLTPSGLQAVKAELEVLKKEKRAEITERIRRARDFSETEENSEYDAAVEEQAIVETRIAELEGVLKDAKIIIEHTKSDFVVIGSTVKVEMDGEIDAFEIVGKMEANPAKKKISNESPVGSALLGARIGEVVEVATPIVRYKCKVLEIK